MSTVIVREEKKWTLGTLIRSKLFRVICMYIRSKRLVQTLQNYKNFALFQTVNGLLDQNNNYIQLVGGRSSDLNNYLSSTVCVVSECLSVFLQKTPLLNGCTYQKCQHKKLSHNKNKNDHFNFGFFLDQIRPKWIKLANLENRHLKFSNSSPSGLISSQI